MKAAPQVQPSCRGGQGEHCASWHGWETAAASVHQALHTRSFLSLWSSFPFLSFFSFFVFRNHTMLNMISLRLLFLKFPFGELAANIKVEWFEGYTRKEEIRVQVFTYLASTRLWVDLGRGTDSRGGTGRGREEAGFEVPYAPVSYDRTQACLRPWGVERPPGATHRADFSHCTSSSSRRPHPLVPVLSISSVTTSDSDPLRMPPLLLPCFFPGREAQWPMLLRSRGC